MKLFQYLIFILFFNFATQAVTINELTETVIFGMETSGKDACILAEIKLMEKARRLVEGESITSESLKLCKSSENEVQCQYFTNTFSSIASVQIVKYEPLKFSNGKECDFSTLEDDTLQVTRKGNFELKKTPKQDDNFDFRVTLNKNQFFSHPLNSSKKLLKMNDTININIETMEDMYINVFQWLPFEDINSINKIFPNNFDQDNYFQSKIIHTIPTNKAFEKYDLRIHFPDQEKIFENDIQEFLMFIATKEDINFFDNYNYADFGEKLASINILKQHQKSYIVHKLHQN